MTKSLLYSLAVVATLACSALSSSAEPLTLYGVKQWVDLDSNPGNGVFSLKAEAGAQPEIYWLDGDMIANGGAVYTDDGKLYILTYLDFFNDLFWTYQMCDFANKTYDYKLSVDGDLDLNLVRDVPGTMTYDPSTNTIYCVSLADTSGTKFMLTTMERETAQKSKVVDLPQRMYTLACTATGEMYGLSKEGILYKVDKYTGELTEVGDTGLDLLDVNQYAVIHYETNTMYWSAHTSDYNGALYTVDLTTAKPTLITVYEPEFQLYGLFIEQVAHESAAPVAVAGVTPVFEGASLSGNINFTLPSVDMEGNELKSDVSYTVSYNGTEAASGSGHPGEAVVAPVTVSNAGYHRFVVNVSNNGTDGQAAGAELWVGMDTPKAVTDVNVTTNGADVTVTWNLPERGVNGGFVDHDKVRYKIIRGPEDVVIEEEYAGTTFTETVERENIYPVMYIVVPTLDGLTGEMAIGNTALVGSHFEPPFDMDLTDPYMTPVMMVVDANGDMGTWEYSIEHGVMWCMWPFSEDRMRDDWLITPAIRLEPGYDYRVSIEMRSEGMWSRDDQDYLDVFAGELAAYLGSAEDPNALSRNIIEKEVVENHKWYERESDIINVDSEGIYHVGLHVTGGQETRNIFNAMVRTISVSKELTGSVSAVDVDGFAARAIEGAIEIHNLSGAAVRVLALDGSVVAETTAADAAIRVANGLYIVSCGSETRKLIVR